MDPPCKRGTDLILDIWLWLPIKLLKHFLQPVIAMADSIADNAEATIKEYEEGF